RALPHRAAERDRREAAIRRARIRRDHRPQTAMRLARPGRGEVLPRSERLHGPEPDQAGRPGRLRHAADRNRVLVQRTDAGIFPRQPGPSGQRRGQVQGVPGLETAHDGREVVRRSAGECPEVRRLRRGVCRGQDSLDRDWSRAREYDHEV
ncbi:hypothetical protein LTR28_004342, partial [Elasticomyces elasticus]